MMMNTVRSMTWAMVLRLLFLFYGFARLVGAQGPDCQIFFHFTANGQTSPTSPNAGLDNRTTACDTWNMSYSVSGFSAVSVVLQTAANNAGVPSTYGTGFPVQQTVILGSNPSTNTTGGFLWVVGYNAWVRVTLASSTGSGVVDGAVFGWKIPSASSSGTTTASNVTITGPLGQALMAASIPVVMASNQTNLPANIAQVAGTTVLTGGVAGSQGVGGLAATGAAPSGNPVPQGLRDSGGNMVIPDYCTSKATFASSASGNVQLVAATSGTIRVCHVDWTGATQTVAKLVSGTGSVCGTGTADETGIFTGAGGGGFGFVMDYASPLPITAAKAVCLNLATGSVGGGTIIYSQR